MAENISEMSAKELIDAFCDVTPIPDEYRDSMDGVCLWGSMLYERVMHLVELGIIVDRMSMREAIGRRSNNEPYEPSALWRYWLPDGVSYYTYVGLGKTPQEALADAIRQKNGQTTSHGN